MHVHWVFVTKYRREAFTKDILDDLCALFASVCANLEAERVEFDGEDDYVHLLVNYPPKVAVSALVNSLKGVSSRMIRKKNYPSIRKKLWGGASIEIIRQYSNSCRRRTDPKDAYGVRAILARPEGRGLPRTGSTGGLAFLALGRQSRRCRQIHQAAPVSFALGVKPAVVGAIEQHIT